MVKREDTETGSDMLNGPENDLFAEFWLEFWANLFSKSELKTMFSSCFLVL